MTRVTPIAATLLRREGSDPGPRVRPRIDWWCAPEQEIAERRRAGEIPVLTVGGTGPVVLVTMDRSDTADGGLARLGVDYARAVLDAGGTPWLVPAGELAFAALLAAAQALVITGGAFDIHPRHYGQEVSGRLDSPNASRTEMELALAAAALRGSLPVLGVCGGMQVMAVADGGSLIQDLPAQPGHEQPGDPATPSHPVRLQGRLATWLGGEVWVNSTHHQAVDQPGRGFHAVGWSPDGVIEAIEHRSHPFAVGVQWHPERLGDGRLYQRLLAAAA